MYQRLLSIAILAIGGFAAASEARALGFGRVPESMPFGQALDLTVPLRLEAGESVAPGCVKAEVDIGDQRLAPGVLSVTLERRGEARDDLSVRLRAAVAVHEPVVAVNLTVGCSGSVSRQFVVFADPADVRTDSARVAGADAPSAPQPAPGLPLVGATSAGGESPAIAAERPAVKRAARKAQADASRPRARAQARQRAPVRTARAETPKRSLQVAAPRLKLEEPEELLKAATLAVAAQDAALASAVQAASAAQAAASAAEARWVALESNLNTLRDEAVAHRAAMEQMRTRLAQAEDQGRLQSALAAFVVALGALAAWLGWRVRALQRERQAAWWQGVQQAGSADAPLAAVDATLDAAEVTAPVPIVKAAPALPSIDDTPPPPQRTAVLPPMAMSSETLTRAVSVDELIDLEQQAEFFVVLGEEDAAVDLLMSHLRSTGGTSPLPYLKLLEIYRRRGDREAYDRMRKRFSQRFNAVAPDWDADPDQGRDLQDYPVVLAALQASWHQPLDAMAELENLLFRKRSGELFELPAYRDVLTLFSVARDLHRRDDQPTPDVDVLLPLAAGDEGVPIAPPLIFDTLASGYDETDAVLEERPTAPVDLDLSEPLGLHDSRVGELTPVRATLR